MINSNIGICADFYVYVEVKCVYKIPSETGKQLKGLTVSSDAFGVNLHGAGIMSLLRDALLFGEPSVKIPVLHDVTLEP